MSTCTVSNPTPTLRMRPRGTYQQVNESFEGDGAIFLKQLIVDDIKVLVLHRILSKQLLGNRKRLTP
jgi:hypothetical protein